MLNITPILALRDNYIWLISHSGTQQALIVDPGIAAPVIEVLEQQRLKLTAILITHHHWDHTQGIAELLDYQAVPVYGSSKESVAHCDFPLMMDDRIAWPDMGIEFQIMEIPGHTLGHIAYVGQNCIFSGDTLFTAGCGRLFEGTAQQMHQSLCRLASLPETYQLYCGHEYTQDNLRFAQKVEPNNPDIMARIQEVKALRAKNLPTVPAVLAQERLTNPFLRCHLSTVQESVSQYAQQTLTDPVKVFAALRKWKDEFA